MENETGTAAGLRVKELTSARRERGEGRLWLKGKIWWI
jgi:hypothetical protein